MLKRGLIVISLALILLIGVVSVVNAATHVDTYAHCEAVGGLLIVIHWSVPWSNDGNSACGAWNNMACKYGYDNGDVTKLMSTGCDHNDDLGWACCVPRAVTGAAGSDCNKAGETTCVDSTTVEYCAKWSTSSKVYAYKTFSCDSGRTCYRGTCCGAWGPDTSTVCTGQSFYQFADCRKPPFTSGTYIEEIKDHPFPEVPQRRSAVGTKAASASWGAWNAWGTCINGVKNSTRTCMPTCGGTCTGDSIRTQPCCANPCSSVGSKSCINSTALETCASVQINSTATCLNLVSSTCQYGCDNGACNTCPPNWQPSTSDYCTVENFTQTEITHCSSSDTRIATGTKNCCFFGLANWNQTYIIRGNGVRMNVTGINCSDGEKVNFTIYNSSNFKVADIKSNITSGKSEATWFVVERGGQYYFNVTLAANTTRKISSEMLGVTEITCGNHQIEPSEKCDYNASPPVRAGETCASKVPGTAGTLGCSNVCDYNTTLCVPIHGEGCLFYTDEGSCGAVTDINIISATPGYDPNADSCKCVWQNNECTVSCTSQHGDCTCTRSLIDQGECVDNMRTIRLAGTISPAGCVDPECGETAQQISCGLAGLDLPFFGFWQFVISITLVIAVYYIRKR